ncbi:MAG: hypothetical protein JNJ49_04385 [Bdellovibrionaceae bacterium]|nr:hypothetical protein [Pseudobdellovibrionaceae bacterium]
MTKISSVRMTYGSIGIVVLIANLLAINGIFVANTVSWIHWLPPILLPFAAITGICPFQIIWEKVGFAKVTCATESNKA